MIRLVASAFLPVTVVGMMAVVATSPFAARPAAGADGNGALCRGALRVRQRF